MNTFQYTFYQISNKKKENQFESIFEEIKNQINVYEKQFDLTLKSYIKEKETEYKESKDKYDEIGKKVDKVYEEALKSYGMDNEESHQYATHKSGINYFEQETYDEKERINKKYKNFLDLYCKSSLIALYSLNENKLNEISNHSSEIFNKDVKLSHFNTRDYLMSPITYLNLVIGIDVNQVEKYVTNLKEVQYLRNKIIHAGSKFPLEKTIIQIVKKHKNSLIFDSKNGFLLFKESKLMKDFFVQNKSFYHELFLLIEKKQNLEIIKNGLKHWLGFLDKNIFITKLRTESFTSKEIKLSFHVSSRKKKIPKFNCKLKIKKATSKSFSFITQIENKTIKEFIDYEEEVEGTNLENIFKSLNISNLSYKTELIIY
jgi:hypothetical protein